MKADSTKANCSKTFRLRFHQHHAASCNLKPLNMSTSKSNRVYSGQTATASNKRKSHSQFKTSADIKTQQCPSSLKSSQEEKLFLVRPSNRVKDFSSKNKGFFWQAGSGEKESAVKSFHVHKNKSHQAKNKLVKKNPSFRKVKNIINAATNSVKVSVPSNSSKPMFQKRSEGRGDQKEMKRTIYKVKAETDPPDGRGGSQGNLRDELSTHEADNNNCTTERTQNNSLHTMNIDPRSICSSEEICREKLDIDPNTKSVTDSNKNNPREESQTELKTDSKAETKPAEPLDSTADDSNIEPKENLKIKSTPKEITTDGETKEEVNTEDGVCSVVDDEDGEEAEGENQSSETSFDYDDDSFEKSETYDLANFNFEHLTKPNQEELDNTQEEYKICCKAEKIIPNAFIVRSLTTTAMILNSQQLGARGIMALCGALCNNCMVTELEISEDDIDLKSMTHICEMYTENQFLTRLDFSNNRMGRLPVKLLIDTLTEADRVVSLNLSGNALEDNDGDIFATYLRDTTYLLELDLSYNCFRDEAAAILGKGLAVNTSIESLSLRWNHLRLKGAMAFLQGMEKNKYITTLDLAWNGLGEDGVKCLCKVIRKNKVIQELDISSNRINMKSFVGLMGVVKKSRTLRTLVVAGNILSSIEIYQILKDLLSSKGQLFLKDLDFGNQTIEYNTLPTIRKLMDEKDLMVSHGPVFGMKEKAISDADELAGLNPVTVLIEFGRLLGMRIKELFEYMDKDGNKSVTRKEIKDGLVEFEIPLPDRSLDILIRKLDTDGDGEIGISELLAVNSQETRNRIKDTIRAREMKMSKHDTESGRCRKILKRLLAARDKKKAAALKEKRALEQGKRKRKKHSASNLSESATSLSSVKGSSSALGGGGKRSSGTSSVMYVVRSSLELSHDGMSNDIRELSDDTKKSSSASSVDKKRGTGALSDV
ncbi:leucine-rich repeat-containing protein 45 [Aplysia californica]|uniref:Leucine-rich repeat-containing protein 45 n=1 Tax=Aplysia californica TaxID=6500 RepID=A0ABM0JNW8_APLCA|nr:leucine-rich repeat-containing protein 45 [Aplysia californica]